MCAAWRTHTQHGAFVIYIAQSHAIWFDYICMYEYVYICKYTNICIYRYTYIYIHNWYITEFHVIWFESHPVPFYAGLCGMSLSNCILSFWRVSSSLRRSLLYVTFDWHTSRVDIFGVQHMLERLKHGSVGLFCVSLSTHRSLSCITLRKFLFSFDLHVSFCHKCCAEVFSVFISLTLRVTISICMCRCRCIHVFMMYICIHIWIYHVYMYTCIYLYMDICRCRCIHVFMYICIHIWICYVYIYTCIYVYMDIFIHA